ncbi:AMP-binding enzyme [Rhodobacteraceae bacterium HTCC2083]|nr:AMP-binding enzyme [Rhodobacteraceae bacterium HTCC2083]
MRTIVYAGGPMYQADIIEAVDHFGDIFVQIYGQGECPMGITALSRFDVSDRTHPNWQARLGSVGRVQSSVEVQIKGADGLCDTDQVGEIIVRGDTVMPGYWRNEAASAQTIVDGWLMTGDMGSIDSDGYVTLVDRSKDVIISGGSNIYPREVEEVLLTHETISEVSVVGRAHPEWGEEVVTFVVPIAGTSIDMVALDAHCLSQIARFKWPKEYIVLSELPKNNYGKVLKTELRKLL